MALETFKAIAGVFADINACREFFSWVTSGVQAHNQNQSQQKTKLLELKDNLWKLKTTMPKMLDLIDRVEWQSHKKSAAVFLPDLKDAVYDAEDLLDEFNYYALKVKVEVSKNSSQYQTHDALMELFQSVEHCDHFNKVKQIQSKLDHIHVQSEGLGLHQAPQKFDEAIRPETSSFSDEPKIFGRKKELKQLVKNLGVGARKRSRTGAKSRMAELVVLPIVGLGGVGKTTMAQQICNDPKVKNHFDCIIWTCVSDDFDIKRLSKEILQHFGQDTSVQNLNVLLDNLASCVQSKTFLLVLDDMWGDTLKDDGVRWRTFCASLINGLQGSMVLVTTRFFEIANLVGTMPHYELNGLQEGVLWDFFKVCAFGSKSCCNNQESLECIGRRILPKLKGSPLAAKTLGRLLRKNLNVEHWEYISRSKLWELGQDVTDIYPALRLSYMYLPQQLKRCFSICALYPKDYIFDRGVLVDIWIAQGYVEPHEASLCFYDLVNRSFFQRAAQQSDKYIIHDLMHDTAQLVAKDECFIIKHASDLDRIPPNVRHLSVFTNNKNVGFAGLMSIGNKKKLRTLICNESYSRERNFSPVIDCWFSGLTNIRVLSFKLSGVREIPESIGNSKHMRYLGLFGNSTFRTLPSSVRYLHHLETIDAHGCVFQTFPEGFSDIISLQKFESKNFSYYKDYCGRLRLSWSWSQRQTCYQTVEMIENQMEELPHWNLQQLEINYYRGKTCPTWLRPNLLPRLRSLEFISCGNIQSIPFFEPPCRDSEGSDNLERLDVNNCSKIDWEELVKWLKNHTSLTYLLIGSNSLEFIPLQVWSRYLPCLEDLSIHACGNLTSIGFSGASSSSVGAFSSIAKLQISSCKRLLSLDEFLTPAYLPVVKKIHVEACEELTSLPVDTLDGFSCLEELRILCCPKLNTLKVMKLPSSLKKLWLIKCPRIEGIRQLGSSSVLERLKIADCPDLRSVGRSIIIAEIQAVYVNGCPKLTELQQPFEQGSWWCAV